MRPAVLVARLRQTLWLLHANGDIPPNVYRELDDLTREISALLPADTCTCASSKLAETETRLSTLEVGLGKLIESLQIMLPPEPFQSIPHRYSSSRTPASRSEKPS